IAGSRRSSSAKLVSTITRAVGRRRRSSRIAPTPSRRGMTRSMSTTSGCSRSACRTASSPSAASPTTSRPSWSDRNVRSPSRTTSWSSTSRTLIVSGTVELQAHGRPVAGRRADLQAAAGAPRALLHRRQAQLPRAQLGIARVEADAVVGDLEHDAPLRAAEPHGDVLGAGVAQRVVQRLLGNAQHLAVALLVAARAVVDGELDVDGVERAEDRDVLAQRAGQPVARQGGRAQLEDQRAQLLERLARELLQARDLLAGARLVAVQQRAGRLGGEHEAEELLADDVVQF